MANRISVTPVTSLMPTLLHGPRVGDAPDRPVHRWENGYDSDTDGDARRGQHCGDTFRNRDRPPVAAELPSVQSRHSANPQTHISQSDAVGWLDLLELWA